MKQRIPLPVHSYQHFSKRVGSERLVNCFVEQSPPSGKAPFSVSRTHGIVTAVAPASGVGRGVYRWKSQLYAVVGLNLYHISSSHVATPIGPIDGDDICSFAENPTQLVVCSSSASYVYDGVTLTKITDVDFESGDQCCGIDGFILFKKPNSGQFFSSALNDALSYSGLDFATAEGIADNIVGIVADHRQAVLAGENSIELWYNAGTSGFPFIRDANGFVEIGCAAGRTLAKVDNTIFWLASDLTVRRLDGITPVRISTHGVEQAIAGYDVSDAYGYGYTHGGHLFYVLIFPSSDATWVYDATTQIWHERQSYGLGRWRVCSMAHAYNRWYVQDFETGKIGYLDQETYTDWEDTQRMEVTFQDVYNSGDLLIHDSLEVIIETGVGTVSGQGSSPQVTLEISDDSGKTWRTKPTKTLGQIGEYATRLRWISLGSSRYRQYRLSISDPVKVVVADAVLEVR
jgi:hypothetical protein